MSMQRTLSIIKPDAVAANHIGAIYNRIETTGLKLLAAKMIQLDEARAKGFYAEHEGKPFFDGLVAFMCSGPIMVQVLEGEDAIRRYRELMGATNPAEACAGTLRADYAEATPNNAVHGSDSVESASREIAFFFADSEIFPH